MGQHQTAEQPIPTSPLSQPGPHGYPMRFGVRLAGIKGFKIYGTDPKQPFRYIEWHTRRQVLHQGAHKKEKSPALVTVHENWPSWSMLPLDEDATAFTITVHNNNNNNATTTEDDNDAGDGGSTDTKIDMDHTRCRPVTFRFELPITATALDGTATTTVETFEWRRAPQACQETRGIRKKTLPMMETGDERLPEEKFVYSSSGSVLVRLTDGVSKRCAPGPARPLGFTKQGEEIVASYSSSRDYRAWYYFQFWGAGATGELGEVFTNVAVASGLAVYQDEEAERARRQTSSADVVVHHGVSPSLAQGLMLPRKADWSRRRSRLGGFHYVQHGSHAPGHAAAQCGMMY